jgi:hypothetical protein
MVGEFSDPSGAIYAMLVNLSLERSAKVIPTAKRTGARVAMISAVDGRPRALDLAKEELWLNAGQGVLLQFGN